MRSNSNARRSTSALLVDENKKIAEAMADHQPLLGFTDIQSSECRGPWYQRIYTRYGSIIFFRFCFIESIFVDL